MRPCFKPPLRRAAAKSADARTARGVLLLAALALWLCIVIHLKKSHGRWC